MSGRTMIATVAAACLLGATASAEEYDPGYYGSAIQQMIHVHGIGDTSYGSVSLDEGNLTFTDIAIELHGIHHIRINELTLEGFAEKSRGGDWLSFDHVSAKGFSIEARGLNAEVKSIGLGRVELLNSNAPNAPEYSEYDKIDGPYSAIRIKDLSVEEALIQTKTNTSIYVESGTLSIDEWPYAYILPTSANLSAIGYTRENGEDWMPASAKGSFSVLGSHGILETSLSILSEKYGQYVGNLTMTGVSKAILKSPMDSKFTKADVDWDKSLSSIYLSRFAIAARDAAISGADIGGWIDGKYPGVSAAVSIIVDHISTPAGHGKKDLAVILEPNDRLSAKAMIEDGAPRKDFHLK